MSDSSSATTPGIRQPRDPLVTYQIAVCIHLTSSLLVVLLLALSYGLVAGLIGLWLYLSGFVTLNLIEHVKRLG